MDDSDMNRLLADELLIPEHEREWVHDVANEASALPILALADLIGHLQGIMFTRLAAAERAIQAGQN